MERLTKPHFVYYLYYEDGSLADIGRSLHPEGRRRVKQRMFGRIFTMKVSRPMSFEKACRLEISEQAKYAPPLTKRFISSAGMLGKGKPQSKAHIQARFAARAGYRHSSETKAKIAAKAVGRNMPEEARKKISAAHTGRRNTEATKTKMSDAAYKRWERQRLLQSGHGHPWRIKDLDEATQRSIA